ISDDAGDGRAVHVNVEDVQEDTDASHIARFRHHRDNLTIGRRDCYRAGGYGAFRIAEEPEAEGREKKQGRGLPGIEEPRNEGPASYETDCVKYSVADHR